MLGNSDVPWNAWIVPICVWLVFFAAVYLVITSLVTFVTRQFIEIEHLRFPLVTPIAELIGDNADSKGSSTPLWKNSMWISGVIVSGVIAASQAIRRHYFSMFPEIPIYFPDAGEIFRGQGGILENMFLGFSIHVNPVTVGIGYLMSTVLSFNLWFFRLVYLFYRGVSMTYFGGRGDFAMDHGTEIVVAGFFGLALYSLWIARHQIKQVFSTAFNPTAESKKLEENSPLPFKVAVIGGLAGIIFIIAFSTLALQIDILISIVFFVIFFSGVLAMTNIRAETGVPLSRIHGVNYCYTIIAAGGRDNVSNNSIIGMSYLQPLFYGSFGVLSPIMLESYKFGDMLKVRRRSLTHGLWIVCVFAFIISFVVGLPLIYEHGSSMITEGRGFHYRWVGFNDFTRTLRVTTIWQTTAWHKIIALVIGFALPVMVMVFRTMFMWFPFHPIGVVMGAHEFGGLAIALFFPWLVKTLAYRFGGSNAVENIRPFFTGLIVGWIGTRLFFSLLGVVLMFV